MNYYPGRSSRPSKHKLCTAMLLKLHAKISKDLFFAFFKIKKVKPRPKATRSASKITVLL